METERNKIREGKPDDRNPDEINANHPAKELKAQHKTDVKESESGREVSQMPAEELQLDTESAQIDKATVAHRQKKDNTDDDDSEDRK